jgi:hypothetical protein
MTDFADFTASLADWANRQDWSPGLLTSFVRSAEEKLNEELRIDRMILTVENTAIQLCSTLPDDWLASDLMLIAADTSTGWTPIRYMPRDQFFRLSNTPYAGPLNQNYQTTFGFYTIEGRSLFFGGVPDPVNGTLFRLHYYAEVPVFSDALNSWVYTKYPSLYRYAALMHADLHAVGEEDKAGGLKMLAEGMIQKLNQEHQRSRASGSRLARGHARSFG